MMEEEQVLAAARGAVAYVRGERSAAEVTDDVRAVLDDAEVLEEVRAHLLLDKRSDAYKQLSDRLIEDWVDGKLPPALQREMHWVAETPYGETRLEQVREERAVNGVNERFRPLAGLFLALLELALAGSSACRRQLFTFLQADSPARLANVIEEVRRLDQESVTAALRAIPATATAIPARQPVGQLFRPLLDHHADLVELLQAEESEAATPLMAAASPWERLAGRLISISSAASRGITASGDLVRQALPPPGQARFQVAATLAAAGDTMELQAGVRFLRYELRDLDGQGKAIRLGVILEDAEAAGVNPTEPIAVGVGLVQEPPATLPLSAELRHRWSADPPLWEGILIPGQTEEELVLVPAGASLDSEARQQLLSWVADGLVPLQPRNARTDAD